MFDVSLRVFVTTEWSEGIKEALCCKTDWWEITKEKDVHHYYNEVHCRTVKSNTSSFDFFSQLIPEVLCQWLHVLIIISFCWVNRASLVSPSCLKEKIRVDRVWKSAGGRGCQVGWIWIIGRDKEAITIRWSCQSGKWQSEKIWSKKKCFTPIFEFKALWKKCLIFQNAWQFPQLLIRSWSQIRH